MNRRKHRRQNHLTCTSRDYAPQPPDIPIRPAAGRCQRETRLNAAGVPVLCGSRGWVRMPVTASDGNGECQVNLCHRHAREYMRAIDAVLGCGKQQEAPNP